MDSNEVISGLSGVFTNEISNHHMIYTYTNDSFLNNNTARYIDIESITREKLDHLLTELQNTDLTTNFDQNQFSNTNKNYETFINILTYIKKG